MTPESTSGRLPSENPAQAGCSPVTDPVEYQPKAQIAEAQQAVQAEVCVIGDD